jgi:5-methylcytosine-specific restriction endonuclease McrA
MAIVHNADGVAGKICSRCREWKPLSEFALHRWRGAPIGDGYKSACKICLNADWRAWRMKNTDKERERYQIYREQNIQRIEDKRKARVAIYRDQINAVRRRRRAANLEQYRFADRAYYQKAEPEIRRQRRRSQYRENPDRFKADKRARRSRKFQAEGSHTEEEWEALEAKYNYTCLCCHRREPNIKLTRDHVVPLGKGGSDYIGNIQPLCRSCNSVKKGKRTDYRISWQTTESSNSDTSEDQ